MGKAATRSGYRRGASSVEYLLVLALVVIPIALCMPMLMNMITVYTGRIVWFMRFPLG